MAGPARGGGRLAPASARGPRHGVGRVLLQERVKGEAGLTLSVTDTRGVLLSSPTIPLLAEMRLEERINV